MISTQKSQMHTLHGVIRGSAQTEVRNGHRKRKGPRDTEIARVAAKKNYRKIGLNLDEFSVVEEPDSGP